MTTFAINGTAILRTTLLATTALALSAGLAAARVGVTSATDGDPLGKPPSDAERVLRIGIDVQANELITTRANDRAHLVFLDGTSLTVGPNAQLTIDKFVYDPNTKTGELAVSASKGVLRLVGGKISKTQPITITTPSSTIGIRGGITILTVEPNKTTSTFVFGKGMTVSAAGQTQMVTRQGTQVTTNAGTPPGQPTVVPAGGYSTQLSQLEGGGGSSSSAGGSGGGGGGQQAAAGGATGGATATGTTGSSSSGSGAADQKAAASGFSSQNSSQTPAAVQPPTVSLTAGSPAQNVANANIVSNALTNAASDQQQQQAIVQQQQQQQVAQPQPQQSVTPTPQVTPAPTPTPTPTPTPATQVIVTRGRFSQEPAYTGFNHQTLAATPVAANNQALVPTGTLANGLATISLADGRFFTVPWQPGATPYAISMVHPTLGALNGTGFVSPNGDFFGFTFTDANNKRVGFAGGTPTTLAQFPTSGFGTHVLSTPGNPGALPWAPPSVANDAALKAAATVSPLYSTYHPNSNPVVGGPVLSSAGAQSTQTTVAIAGLGAAQKSYVGTFIGDYFKDFNVDSTFNSGGYYATYRGGANETISRATSAESTYDVGGAHSIFGPNAERMLYSPSSYRSTTASTNGTTITSGTTTSAYQASLDQPYNNVAGVDYRPSTLATKVDNPAALNASRTSQNFTGGYVGGIVEQTTSSGAQSTRTIGGLSPNTFPAQVFMQTDAAANRVFATITVGQWDGPNTSATFNLGGTSGPRFSTQAFVNDKIYALRDRPTDSFSTQVASVTSSGNTSTGTNIAARTNMVSYGAAPVDAFFAAQGVTPCTCDFMTWGWWSGEVRYGSGSVYNPNGRDRLHLASYVAGVVTPTLQMPTTGVATFSGHAIGNVQSGANAYVAAGGFTKVWDFAAQSGAVTISNFDGVTYTGTANQFTGPSVPASQYGGAISGGGRTGNLTGSFYSAGAVPAKGTGGSFNVTGPNYKAGGIFAGQR